jgi:hypothetical protein
MSIFLFVNFRPLITIPAKLEGSDIVAHPYWHCPSKDFTGLGLYLNYILMVISKHAAMLQ